MHLETIAKEKATMDNTIVLCS